MALFRLLSMGFRSKMADAEKAIYKDCVSLYAKTWLVYTFPPNQCLILTHWHIFNYIVRSLQQDAVIPTVYQRFSTSGSRCIGTVGTLYTQTPSWTPGAWGTSLNMFSHRTTTDLYRPLGFSTGVWKCTQRYPPPKAKWVFVKEGRSHQSRVWQRTG